MNVEGSFAGVHFAVWGSSIRDFEDVFGCTPTEARDLGVSPT